MTNFALVSSRCTLKTKAGWRYELYILYNTSIQGLIVYIQRAHTYSLLVSKFSFLQLSRVKRCFFSCLCLAEIYHLCDKSEGQCINVFNQFIVFLGHVIKSGAPRQFSLSVTSLLVFQSDSWHVYGMHTKFNIWFSCLCPLV